VTYSIARLSHILGRRLPWEEIWEKQGAPDELIAPLKMMLIGVREVILHPPSNRNITEWCKRDDCWAAVLSLPLQLDLPDTDTYITTTGDGSAPPRTAAEAAVIEAVRVIPSEVWYAAAKWAKETDSLQRWQRGLSYSLGTVAARGRVPSSKQARQG